MPDALQQAAATLGSVLLAEGCLWLLGMSVGRAAATLCLIQVACVWSLRVGSREAGAFELLPLGHIVAAVVAQFLPLALPSASCVASCAAVCTSTYVFLVRMPRCTLASLQGKVIIVTGCTTGIGLETARQLLALGATVVFACRTESKTKIAIADASGPTSAGKAVYIALDLSSCESVRQFVAGFLEQFDRCDALVCNAGAQFTERSLSRDGWEQNMASNHLGHWLLTKLMLPTLRASAGRAVAVASALHKKKAIGGKPVLASLLRDPMSESSYGMFEAYAKSKLAQVALSAELQRREPSITSVSLHPGNVFTEVTRRYPPLLQMTYSTLQPLLRTIQPSVVDGASTSVYAAACLDPQPLRGAYLERSARAPPAPAVADPEVARQLYELSERLVAPWSAPIGR